MNESQSSENRWEAAITLLSRPQLVLQGAVEYLLAWSFTRGWWRLLGVNSPWLLLLAVSIGLVGYGASLSQKTLLTRYSDWVVEELPDALREADTMAAAPKNASDSNNPATESERADPSGAPKTADQGSPTAAISNPDDQGLVSRYGELLLRRLLQLQDSSSRITYLVAVQLARKDRVAQARQMMRRIAPAGGGGFAPAHAWLAVEQVKSGELSTEADRQLLKSDLSMAARWAGSSPVLLGGYSQLLEREGDIPQAMSVLEQAASRASPETRLALNLKLAELAVKHGQPERYERVAKVIKDEIQARIEAGTVTADEFAYLANLYLIEKEPEKARRFAEQGLKLEPDQPRLRRTVSESYRLEYLMSMQASDGQTKVNLGFLDAALKVDPTNPAVGVEIVRLLNLGQATPELKEALEKQLAAGQATALTHILLANRYLLANQLTEALPHLEIAQRQVPNNPIILNNLALVLARTKPDELERALKLATDAVTAAPSRSDFHDTLGEIRLLSGDKLGAVESYEYAIGLDGNLDKTRRKLAKLYRELGMNEMAAVQEREIQTRQAKVSEE